jgi:glycerophosphoryl diester phosphodiesterase
MAEKTRTFIWAHRGASGYEIDNTIESFNLALEMGADGLESDVVATKDKYLILYHDRTLPWRGKRVTPDTLTLEQIQDIDLGQGRKVPLVKEVFEYYKAQNTRYGTPVTYSLDLKSIETGKELIRLAHQIGMAENVELTPQDDTRNFWHIVRGFREQSAAIKLVNSCTLEPGIRHLKTLQKKMYYQNWKTMEETGMKAVNLRARYATPERIEELRQHGVGVYVWDCHTQETATHFIELGVDAIYTNFPDMAVKLRAEIQQG